MNNKIEFIKGTRPPLKVKKSLPWNKMKNCIVLYMIDKDSEEFTRISCSDIKFKDQIYMTEVLNKLNNNEMILEEINLQKD